MTISEDFIQELRYFWVKDMNAGVSAALATATPGTTTAPGSSESLPETISSTSINDLSAGYHRHAVEAVSDSSTVGNYGKLLKAGLAGELSVNAFTALGNLTAGAGTLRVNAAGGRVGIGMDADPQFALDVYGPVRAPYFIGKHAIQLPDALMICHMDGKENDLTGDATGHRGQAAIVGGGVTWQKGKFSKAIAIGEATNNLLTNPSFDAGVSGWAATGGGASIGHSAEHAWVGTYACRATLPASTTAYCSVTCAASTTYAYSAYVWSDIPATLVIGLSDFISQALGSGNLSIPAKTWTRISFVGTTNAVTARYLTITNVGGSTATIWIDAAQVEAKAYVTPYTPSGARATCALRYLSEGNLDRTIGTIMFWVNVGASNAETGSGGSRTVFRVDATGPNYILIDVLPGNIWRYVWGTNTSNAIAGVTPGVWQHVALTFDGVGNLAFYLNGVLVSTAANGVAISSVSGFGGNLMIDIGQYSGSGQYSMNGLIDEIAITSTAASATLIKAVYESDAPVFAESSTFSFRIPQSRAWANEDGLFVVDNAGNPVMGAIAAATFAWGGQSLTAGDFLLGYGNNYLKWDRAAAKLLLSAGDAQTLIDNTGITLLGGTTFDTRSAITFKYSGDKVGDIYGINQTSGSAYSKLVMESRPAANNSWGALQLIATRRDGFGSESAFTQLLLTSENAANAGSKEDLYLDGIIRRSFTRQYSLDLLEYGSKLFYTFGPNLFQWFALQGGVGLHFHLVLKPSSGAVFVTSSTILAGGAAQPFTVAAGEVITVTAPAGVLQWVRTSGTNTYSGCVDITIAA